MRWAKRIGMVLLVLLNLGLVARNANLQSQIDQVRSDIPQPFDPSDLEEALDEMKGRVNDLEIAEPDTAAVDDLRGDAVSAIERVEQEFAYMCAQFTQVVCLSFPNGAGR